jgi:hypothetical protein
MKPPPPASAREFTASGTCTPGATVISMIKDDRTPHPRVFEAQDVQVVDNKWTASKYQTKQKKMLTDFPGDYQHIMTIYASATKGAEVTTKTEWFKLTP